MTRVSLGLLLLFFSFRADADPQEILAKTRSVLKAKGDFIERRVERIGNQTVKLEAMVSLEGDFKELPGILQDRKSYGSWLLQNLNDRPGGGSYWVKIVGLQVIADEPHWLKTFLKVDFPLYQRDMERKTKVDFQSTREFVRTDLTLEPTSEGAITSANATIYFFPAEGEPGRLWAYADAAVKLNHWLLYQALPHRALMREAGERIQIIVDNYQREETRRMRAGGPARLNQIPTEKKAAAFR